MAIIKTQRLKQKADGTFDKIHQETSASLVMMNETQSLEALTSESIIPSTIVKRTADGNVKGNFFIDAYGRQLFVTKQIAAAELDNLALQPGLYVIFNEPIPGINDGANYHYVEVLGGHNYQNGGTGFLIQRAWRYSNGLYGGMWIRQSSSSSTGWVGTWTQVLAPATDWIAPTLLNGWENYSGFAPAGYLKDALGFVHLRGLVRYGTVGAGYGIFILPSGYRPSNIELFTIQTQGNASTYVPRINVSSGGGVEVINGNNGYISLSGISFKVA